MMSTARRVDAPLDEPTFDRAQTMIREMRMGGNENPLVKYFNDDSTSVIELVVDLNERFVKAKNQECMPLAPWTIIPCAWPYVCLVAGLSIACATPCDYLMCAEGRLKKVVSAHKLVLRERSLHYVVETHRQNPMCMPLIFNMCITGEAIDRFEEVYPLEMVTWSGVVPAPRAFCDKPVGPDTFVVKVNNDVHPAVAIDGPQNAEEFVEKLNQQKQIMASELLPPDIAQQFQSYMMATSAGMGAFKTIMSRPGKRSAGTEAMQRQMMQQAMAQASGTSHAAPVANLNMNRGGGAAVPVAASVEMSSVILGGGAVVASIASSVHPTLLACSVEAVAESLTKLGLSQYADRFKAERIDGEALGDLDEGVLEADLGVGSALHRRKIMRWIQKGD